MISAFENADIVFHIGAGAGEEARAWLDAGLGQIVLVEPNPQHAATLARLAMGSDRVQVVEAAITAEDGPTQLHVFNLPDLSSLCVPEGLLGLLPGLRETALTEVAGLTAGSMLSHLGKPEGRISLMVDAPGSEMTVLQSFLATDIWPQVTSVHLICSEEALFVGSVSRADLQNWLHDQGFSLSFRDATDPDWPRLSFVPDTKADLTALTAQLAQSEATLADAQARITQQDHDLSELRQSTISLRDQITHLTKDRDVATASLTQVKAESQTKLAEAQTQLEHGQTTSAAEQKIMAELRADLEAEKARLAEASTTETAQAKRIKELEALVIATRKTVASLTEEKTSVLASQQAAVSRAEAAEINLAEMTEALAETRKNFAVSQDQKRAALEELAEERKQRAALNTDRTAEKEKLTEDVTKLRQQIAALETSEKKLKAEGTGKDAELTRRADRIKELEFRQNLMRDELRRTEGQIDLIKDLLLRGDRL